MDRSTPITLISTDHTQNGNGEFESTGTARKVYCNLRSVSRSEGPTAGEAGLRAEYQATVFGPDYEGEEIAELALRGGTQRFVIYRTYMGPGENLELYLGNRIGETDLPEPEPDPTPTPTPTPDPEAPAEEVTDGDPD